MGQDAPRRHLQHAGLQPREFRTISELVQTRCGIKMPPTKKTMLESRLMKRLRALGMESFKCYCEYLHSPEGMSEELVHMIDAVTTNKTDFFREPDHFHFLLGRVLPEMRAHGHRRELGVWSAGCSTGEEPYSLAMALGEYEVRNPGTGFSILGTDVSTSVLEKASAGVYDMERTAPIPAELLKKYFLKSKDPGKGLVIVTPALRSKVRFRRVNFMEDEFGFRDSFDVIFCRNVLIYFDKRTQEAIINRLCRRLRPGGYMFIGHSETLNGLDTPLSLVASTVYRKHR